MFDRSKEKYRETPYHENIICIDTETGGLDYAVNPILSIGGLVHDYKGNEQSSFFSYIFHEKRLITDEAMSINKIPMEIIESAPPAKEVMKDFLNWFVQNIEIAYPWGPKIAIPQTHIIGYNLYFDLQFIETYIREYYPAGLDPWKFSIRQKYDLQQTIGPYDRQLTLDKMGKKYDVPNLAPHTVMGDVGQTMGIYHQVRGERRIKERLYNEKMEEYLAKNV